MKIWLIKFKYRFSEICRSATELTLTWVSVCERRTGLISLYGLCVEIDCYIKPIWHVRLASEVMGKLKMTIPRRDHKTLSASAFTS